jgi:hypothetical protein
MDRDKMREEIAKMLDEIRDEYCLSDHESRLVYSDRILSLLAPVLADAGKWRLVKEIAKYKGNCGECPNDSLCMEFPTSACHICEGVVNALSEKCDDGSGRIRAEWAKEE